MANIEFNGIQIDAETVRTKLAEYDRRDRPCWPVFITDLAFFGSNRPDDAMILEIDHAGDIFPRGQYPTFFSVCKTGLWSYVDAVVRAGQGSDNPPAVPECLVRHVWFGTMPDGCEAYKRMGR